MLAVSTNDLELNEVWLSSKPENARLRVDFPINSRLGATRVTTRETKALAAPSTKLGLRPDSARIVLSTTCCGVRVSPKAAERDAAPTAASPAALKNGVSVTPGHTARTRTPCLRSSAQSASVKDNTKAFVAPYTAIFGNG